jgi:hypothetical protein
MGRKTFQVEDLKNIVNGICKDSSHEYAERRKGAMNVLEHILHETKNYQGFRYLRAHEVVGQPGINASDDGSMPHPDYIKRFENTDPTRVCYF